MIPMQSTLGARRHDRIRTRLKVRFGIGSPDREEFSESISEGGLYLSTNDIYKVGTRLTVMVEFPEGTVCHTGEVVWAIRVPEHLKDSMVCGLGISFVDPDPEWVAFFRRWKASVDPPLESPADFD